MMNPEYLEALKTIQNQFKVALDGYHNLSILFEEETKSEEYNILHGQMYTASRMFWLLRGNTQEQLRLQNLREREAMEQNFCSNEIPF